jgi:hypothetical protein
MDLKKFLPKGSNDKKEEYYWALSIETGWVQAGVWKIYDKKAEVVYSSQPVSWVLDSELINACDTVLSSAIQNFPEDFVEPSKCVFGVSYAWVEDGEIGSEYLDKIKKVCVDLSLTPVGFVVLPEAIAHLYKSEEGVPLTSVILGVYKDNLELSLFSQGNLIGTTQIARSVSLAEDVVEGLVRLNSGENLPSRFLVYDGKASEADDSSQDLIKANWEDFTQLKFLHPPKIETVSPQKKIYAIALAGASELEDVTSLETKEENTATHEVPPKVVTEEIMNESLNDNDEFIKDTAPEDFGFLENENMENISLPKTNEAEENITSQNVLNNMESNVSEVEDESSVTDKPVKAKLSLDLLRGKFSDLIPDVKKIKFRAPVYPLGGRPFILGIIFLVIFIISGAIWWWYFPKATVTIYVSTRKLGEDVNITVDTVSKQSNFSDNVLAGKLIDTEVSGEQTKDTTGTKLIGDKAKGELTIYRAGPSIVLPAGTSFSGPENLKFTLGNTITVASGSAATPGETVASVIATDIGAQYNLASNTSFSVSNYSTSDMEGKNKSAFTGGSSREISAVSKEDANSLMDELKKELLDKTANVLQNQIEEEGFFILNSQEISVVKSDFDRKVGDEGKTLKLSLTVKAVGISINNKELSDFSESILKDKIPGGFILRGSQSNYSFSNMKKDSGKYLFTSRITANLLPDINPKEVSEKIKGKYANLAEEFLNKEVPGFTKAEIKMKPSLPEKIRTLPHIAKNIEVIIASDK